MKTFREFLKFNENKICWRLIFEILIIHKPSLGSYEVPHKIWARSVQFFNVYWIQTNRQTPRQAKYRRRRLFSLKLVLATNS